MFKKYRAGFYAAAVYIGAVMGAGFATGQELMRYFVRFGRAGLWGIAACGILFAFVGCKVLCFMYINGLNDYRQFLRCIMGERAGAAAEAVSFCFITALYSSMLAAADSLTYSVFGINGVWGSAAVLAVCAFMTVCGIKGLGTVNIVLCPLLVCGSVFTGLLLYFGSVSAFAPVVRLDDNILGSCAVYISYNVISSLSLLCAVSKQIKDIREAAAGGIAGGIVLGLAGVLLALPLYKYSSLAGGSELPVLVLISSKNKLLGYCYVLMLAAAVLTTAAGNCYSAVESLRPVGKADRCIWAVLVSGAAFLLSRMGFADIVGRLYYIFGCLGLAELAIIVSLKLKR